MFNFETLKNTKSFFLILLFFGLGLSFVADFSSTGHIIERDPASLPATKSFLNPDFLKQDLASHFKVVNEDETKRLVFNGLSKNLCDQFTNAKLVLKAEGVLHNGEVPAMSLDLPCLSQNKEGFFLEIKKAALNQAAFEDVSTWRIHQLQLSSDSQSKIINFSELDHSSSLFIEK